MSLIYWFLSQDHTLYTYKISIPTLQLRKQKQEERLNELPNYT